MEEKAKIFVLNVFARQQACLLSLWCTDMLVNAPGTACFEML